MDGSISIKKAENCLISIAMGDGKVGLTGVPMALTHPSPASPARIQPAGCCFDRFIGRLGSWEEADPAIHVVVVMKTRGFF